MDEKGKDYLLFHLSANPGLAEKVAEKLHLPLSPSEVSHFADGETLARPLVPVQDKRVYVIQSFSSPVNDRLMEFLIFADALKNAKAKEISLIAPYYGYCRQDRITREGEPISAKLVANLLVTAGVDRFITVDLHAPQIRGFFPCKVDTLTPIPLFGEYYSAKFAVLGIPFQNVVVIAPDHGSVRRAEALASLLHGSGIVLMDKHRPRPNQAEIVDVVGEVQGKSCIIIDDIIDTAGTVLACADALFAKGARSVFVGGTHGIFSSGALPRLLHSRIDDIAITDAIEQNIPGVSVISIAPLLVDTIEAIENGFPIPGAWQDFS